MNSYSHIILFKFKPDVNVEKAEALMRGIGRLQREIKEIKNYIFGRNDDDNPHNDGFEYSFVMSFKSKEDREKYQHHPMHQAYIAEVLEPYVDKAIVFDFESKTDSLEALA